MVTAEYDPWDDVELDPQTTVNIHKDKVNNNEAGDPWDALDFDEGFWSNAFRTMVQIPLGIAEGTTYGIGAGLMQMLALGESDLGVEEWHKLRELAEQEGIPFDEEAYENARSEMLGMIPTVSNLAEKTEELTGLPLTPKNRLQKGLRFTSTAGKLIPGKGTAATGEQFTRNVPTRTALGGAVEATREGMIEQGLPEQIADAAAFGWLGPVGVSQATKNINLPTISKKTKPSSIPERRFENVTSPQEVPKKKIEKINQKLKDDFEKVSDKIIAESPIGETAENLRSDPAFKQQSRELLEEAQNIADGITKPVKSTEVKKSLIDTASKTRKGFSANEYDKSYIKFIKESLEEIPEGNITAGQLVEQYRKNNQALGEYFEPGSSKALNRAKRDALLDQNRSIALVMEKSFPESELSQVFKEGNARWTKIMDVEAVDKFVEDVFKNGINFRKMNDFFDKQNYGFIFKRALGEKGYQEFTQLIKDMLTSETPYKMLKVAKDKGWIDLYKIAGSYILHPKLGFAKLGWDAIKTGYRSLINTMLDKPKISFKFGEAVKDLKAGKFQQAENAFNKLNEEIKVVKPDEIIAEKTNVKSSKKSFQDEAIQKFKDYGFDKKVKDFAKVYNVKSLRELGAVLESNEPILVRKLEKELGKSFDEILEAISEKKPFDFEVKGEDVTPKPKVEPKQLEAPKKQLEDKSFKSDLSKEESAQKFNQRKKEKRQTSEPILLPYNPKKKGIEKVAVENILNGKPLNTKQKDTLRGKQVSLYTTRGKGQQYHGSRSPIKELNPEIYDVSGEQNIYGAGFYTTDALDIAEGYSKAKKAKTPTIYQVKEKIPQKLYDMEKSFDEIINELKNKKGIIEDALNENPKNLRELYNNISEYSVLDNLPAYEVQEIFGEIENILRNKGYEGLRHTGGLLTKNPAHEVKIYWNPENLEIEQISVPRKAKQTAKTAKKPIEELSKEKRLKPRTQTISVQTEGKPETKVTSTKKLPKKTKAPEKLTESKIDQLERQDISQKGLKSQKEFILDKLQDVLDNPSKYSGVDKIPLDVPGDGNFKIHNNEKAIKQFYKDVKNKWPDKPLRKSTKKQKEDKYLMESLEKEYNEKKGNYWK